ncbi:hypothetical protein HOG98_08530 [bacterium]|jgi:hypothetical protein|nr:hypothetical protein [bacterium]
MSHILKKDMIYQIPKIFTSTGNRFFSNLKFPKTSHLPHSNSATGASGACFDPTELRANAAKREASSHLNTKPVK